MITYELIRCESHESLAAAAAEYWVSSLPSCPSPIGIAVSGGRIAGDFFRASTRRCKERGTALDSVHFFWADERCVPPDHEESNFGLAWEHMLNPLRIRPTNVHRIRGEIDPIDAAAQSEQDLRDWFSASGSDPGLPVLDFVFLGMGEDGHVASLFPDGLRPGEASGLFVPVIASKPPPRRISINYQLLQSAKEVLVLAAGQGKTNALRISLAREGDTPLARVLKMRAQTRIYTDIVL